MSPTFKPHGYQKRGIKWIVENPKCGLFLPMGAGKTPTTLEAIRQLMYERFEVEKVLIIGPVRVIKSTWPDEIQKWNFPLSYSLVTGTPAQRLKALEQKADLYLIGKENVPWLTENYNWDFDMVVVDELSAFKNPQAKRFKALRKFIPDRFVGLTGTPAPKGLPDLWAQLYLMDRGERLGRTLGMFRTAYLYPLIQNGYTVYKWGVKDGAEEAIYKKISDICMSISEKEYATLPDLNLVDYLLDLESISKYRQFKRDMVLPFEEDRALLADNAGVLCGKLLQFCSGQIYTDRGIETVHEQKLDALEDLVTSANGNPIIVFYYYKHELERLKKRFPQARTLDGPDTVREWNHGDIDILLLHPASSGHGLNLQQGGHIAVWFTLPNWNLELYQQANARLYRQGQTEKVTIYHIIFRQTIDVTMLEALKAKSVTQENLLESLVC